MFKRYVAGVIVAWLRQQDEKHEKEIQQRDATIHDLEEQLSAVLNASDDISICYCLICSDAWCVYYNHIGEWDDPDYMTFCDACGEAICFSCISDGATPCCDTQIEN